MIKRKSKFLTFCFSLIPGAGHMYLGFMKQGISLMTLFFGIIFVSVFLNMGAVFLFLPVLWFYSFFDAHNKNSMSDEDFYRQEDHFLLNMDFSELNSLLQGKFRIIIAAVLILLGASLLFSNFMSFLRNILPWALYSEMYYVFTKIPQIVVAIFIILVGLHLIRGGHVHDMGDTGSYYRETDSFRKDFTETTENETDAQTNVVDLVKKEESE